ncbi:uncharacterized protein LOC119278097 [Triticum dicoccoides]|uniref:uncharacterized protein LOC119278097 n=1 Tax=Triticum dicoccoides TaxID=85692 RepID=UPI00188F1ABD|nr:uncharacterized protein LOC119278097 [Triticum dicoccoides]XP_044454285.1 uncharacterized protein LOC123186614 [Triticum aestivum]
MRLRCGELGRGPLGGAACRGCGVCRARRTDASASVLDEVVAATVMARRRDGEQQWPLVPVQEIRKRHGVRAERSQAEGSVVAPMRRWSLEGCRGRGSLFPWRRRESPPQPCIRPMARDADAVEFLAYLLSGRGVLITC